MNDWRAQMANAVADFVSGDQPADYTLPAADIEIEYLAAPHHPSGLPSGKMAVCAFWGDGDWLMIGIAGAKSNARYQSQHSLYTTHAIFCLILGQCRKACSGWVRRSLPISSRPMRKMDFAYRP